MILNKDKIYLFIETSQLDSSQLAIFEQATQLLQQSDKLIE